MNDLYSHPDLVAFSNPTYIVGRSQSTSLCTQIKQINISPGRVPRWTQTSGVTLLPSPLQQMSLFVQTGRRQKEKNGCRTQLPHIYKLFFNATLFANENKLRATRHLLNFRGVGSCVFSLNGAS